jgi:hypothetical protein
MEDFELASECPLVLLLGNISHEGVVSSLAAARRQYKQKYLESQVKNWWRVLKFFSDFEVKEVIWKLSPVVYGHLVDPEYRDVSEKLLAAIAKSSHIIFVHENVLAGGRPGLGFKVDDDEYLSDHFAVPSETVRSEVHELLAKHGLKLLPYATNAEVTVMASAFVAETEQGLILRMYVPVGRMWSGETDRILLLFRDYLTRVKGLSIRMDQIRTDRGIIYEFHGENATPPQDLNREFDEFAQFLDACAADPDRAHELLVNQHIPAAEATELMIRYSKEANRLRVDLKQERERRLLGIRHRLESELVDLGAPTESLQTIGQLINSLVPAIADIRLAAAMEKMPLQISATQGTNLTVNLNPQIIQTVHGIVAQEIRGDANLTQHDQELLSLIQEHAPQDSVELGSAVHELADPSAPTNGRIKARQRLSGFLMGVTSRIGNVAAGVLQKYIENQLDLR